MNDKIMQRLKRLRAMADDASSEHEAMIAAERLQKLLARHGLNEADLGAGEAVGEDTLDAGRGAWARTLATHIARLYFCDAYYHTDRGGRSIVTVQGAGAYRTTALIMIRTLVGVVDRQARVSSKVDRPSHVAGNTWIASFRTAAAMRIARRCMELVAAGRRGELCDEDGGTLPMLASLYDTQQQAIAKYRADNGVHVRGARERPGRMSGAAARKGDALGRSVSLGGGIEQHAPKALEKS